MATEPAAKMFPWSSAPPLWEALVDWACAVTAWDEARSSGKLVDRREAGIYANDDLVPAAEASASRLGDPWLLRQVQAIKTKVLLLASAPEMLYPAGMAEEEWLSALAVIIISCHEGLAKEAAVAAFRVQDMGAKNAGVDIDVSLLLSMAIVHSCAKYPEVVSTAAALQHAYQNSWSSVGIEGTPIGDFVAGICTRARSLYPPAPLQSPMEL